MNVFKWIKAKYVIDLRSGKDPIIIAGLGRCGTTLLFNSIMVNHYYSGFKDMVLFNEFSGDYSSNIVYKTHDYPPSRLPENVKVIFMFGDIYNTVISTHNQINLFGILHHKHLNSKKFNTNDEIFHNDTLNLEKLFSAWYKKQNFSFLTLRYEALYDPISIRTLSEYLNLNVKLLPKKERKTNWKTHPLQDTILQTYGNLERKIIGVEDIKIWT